MKQILFLGLLIMTLIQGCIEPPDYPIEPVIEFLGVDKTSVIAQTTPSDPNRSVESVYITFGFTDGDGDIGGGDTTTVRLFDSRLGPNTIAENYSVDQIPQAGASNGISGEITVKVLDISCFPNSAPRDTVIFTIQMEDKAGHQSNIIEVTPIELICD